jgi:transposase-like protein
MKKVCPKCGSNRLHKHGKKRRKCVNCGKTCSIKSGRKRSKQIEKYLLDRSTLRRISSKIKMDTSQLMKQIMKELKYLPSPLLWSKKIYLRAVIY